MTTTAIQEFGAKVLRQKAAVVDPTDISSKGTKQLIQTMRGVLLGANLGVALAAPQIGVGKRVVVIAVRPTKHRPHVEETDLVMINPRIAEVFGYRTQLWEGCLSAGKSGLFAKTPRYKKIMVTFYDEAGKQRTETFEGLMAQIIQHETDHLDGVLFVDRVKDSTTYMTKRQYLRMVEQRHRLSSKVVSKEKIL